MKKDTVCPKCKGTMVKGHMDLMMGLNWKPDKTGIIGRMQRASSNLEMYKCTKCGFVESYIR